MKFIYAIFIPLLMSSKTTVPLLSAHDCGMDTVTKCIRGVIPIKINFKGLELISLGCFDRNRWFSEVKTLSNTHRLY